MVFLVLDFVDAYQVYGINHDKIYRTLHPVSIRKGLGESVVKIREIPKTIGILLVVGNLGRCVAVVIVVTRDDVPRYLQRRIFLDINATPGLIKTRRVVIFNTLIVK